MNKKEYIVCFESCKFTKGVINSVVIDLHRHYIMTIPNDLYDFVMFSNRKSIDEIRRNYSEYLYIVDEYLQFLFENEIIFYCNFEDLERFTVLNESVSDDCLDNAVLYISDFTFDFVPKIICELDNIGIKYLVIIVKHRLNFLEFCKYLNDTHFRSIDIYLDEKYISFSEIEAKVVLLNYQMVFGLIYFNSEIDLELETVFEFKKIVRISQNLKQEFCGFIHEKLFVPEFNSYFNAKQKNSCLNGKISIDNLGEVRNCPSMSKTYGNIRDTTLVEAIEKSGFKDLWGINKDKIHVCRDCEYRYICTDCRAYVEDPQDILSKPLKCGYNPYTGEWSEWSINPLKQMAIDFYGMRELVDAMNKEE